MGPTTDVCRKILRNIHEGRDPYDGFTGSQLGGAIRSFQLWWGAWRLVDWDPAAERWALTDEGLEELEKEN